MHEQRRKIASVLLPPQIRRQQRVEQRLLHIAEPRDPRRDPVDRRVEIIQSHVHAPVQPAATDDLLAQLPGLIVKQHHVVGVPPHGARNVQRDFREKRQQRGYFIAHQLGRMIVPVVHERDAAVRVQGGIAQGKLRAAHGVALHPDAEHLALHTGLDLGKVERLGQYLVDGRPVPHSRAQPVGGNVLKPVPGPDVHRADLPQLLRQILADTDTRLAMLHPKAAGFLIGRGQGQRVAPGMREKRRVKIRAKSVLPAKRDPRGKVLRLQTVPIHPFPRCEDGVGCVQIQLLRPRTEPKRFGKIRHQLLRRSRPPGIVAGRLDAAGQRLIRVGVKAPHVVPLPAVQGHGDGFQLLQRGLRIHADGRILCLSLLIAHRIASICTFKFPSAVASMGRATTCLPVASAVNRLRNAFFAPPPTTYSLSNCNPVLCCSSSMAFT